MSLVIDPELSLPLAEIELSAIRSQGAGGQHVNKTSSAVQLRFDIAVSSLPEDCKQRLLARTRTTKDGLIVIKAQEHRSQELNRQAALERLGDIIRAARRAPVPRKATRPSRRAKARRTDQKTQRGRLKSLRRRTDD
ncbi:MAG TPA: alternative ribosome rescue aminoacyl-tRNA hydrolase ArfB [Solimonas sp.]|nr:alternative ribosome rescue aminoacyl-tRNA hydrolase ArfB [Solimonas sp.]